jgi:phosphopantothenoylcysteine decarboxylase / phosphopantothenate---cysteine ligase
MHPVENIRGSLSRHLDGRRIVLGVCGSIAAVKAVELARELVRHGADVVPVMTSSATRIVHPDALEFATGNRPVTSLGGQVEHVALLGDVKGKADLLLVAPATANTVAKMALGIDDTPVTTCATVAFGTGVPVVVAPAMHEAMLRHPIVQDHARALVDRLGVTWVEPLFEERKAKLADVEAIAEAVIHRLAQRDGPLAGKRALVVSGATVEPVDAVRVLTNRSSGATGILVATELSRLGTEVTLWQGHATVPVPAHLAPCAVRYSTHADLIDLVRATDLAGFDHVWMPAAIGDYAAKPAKGKIPSGQRRLRLDLGPTAKVIEAVRAKAPKATLVAFKAESDAKTLVARARDRLRRYKADFVVANLADSFGSASTTAHLVGPRGVERFTGPKADVLPALVRRVAGAPRRRAARKPPGPRAR